MIWCCQLWICSNETCFKWRSVIIRIYNWIEYVAWWSCSQITNQILWTFRGLGRIWSPKYLCTILQDVINFIYFDFHEAIIIVRSRPDPSDDEISAFDRKIKIYESSFVDWVTSCLSQIVWKRTTIISNENITVTESFWVRVSFIIIKNEDGRYIEFFSKINLNLRIIASITFWVCV